MAGSIGPGGLASWLICSPDHVLHLLRLYVIPSNVSIEVIQQFGIPLLPAAHALVGEDEVLSVLLPQYHLTPEFDDW